LNKKTEKKYNEENKMEEKIHFAITFTETDDGYKLEASGDKDTLHRLGISPRMLDKRRMRTRASRRHRFHRHAMTGTSPRRRRRFSHSRDRGKSTQARRAAYRTLSF
jgi:hypothetical protein